MCATVMTTDTRWCSECTRPIQLFTCPCTCTCTMPSASVHCQKEQATCSRFHSYDVVKPRCPGQSASWTVIQEIHWLRDTAKGIMIVSRAGGGPSCTHHRPCVRPGTSSPFLAVGTGSRMCGWCSLPAHGLEHFHAVARGRGTAWGLSACPAEYQPLQLFLKQYK